MDFRIQTPSQLTHHLRALRIKRGWSQAELGAVLGLSQSRVARMEKSPTSISVEALLHMLSALQAEMLLSDTPGMRNTALFVAESGPGDDW
jgi:HTH-type transcriptional regulator/antitoxin HipB